MFVQPMVDKPVRKEVQNNHFFSSHNLSRTDTKISGAKGGALLMTWLLRVTEGKT